MMTSYQNLQRGSTLIYVLIISLTTSIVLLAVLQSISIIRSDSFDRYYNRIADEAAEAGLEYAKACITKNGRRQSWPTGQTLTPNKRCNGTVISSASPYVLDESGRARTTFVVGDLDESGFSSALINSTGITESLGTGDTVKQTFKQPLKMRVSWDPNLNSTKSASGWKRTCGILSGDVYCWGNNNNGQLGDGTTTDSTIPVMLKREPSPGGIGNYPIIDLAAAAYTNCVIIDTGTSPEVYCWGINDKGQLGIGTSTPNQSSVPVRVTALSGKNVTSLGSFGNGFCAITNVGDLYCWGENDEGQVGDNTRTNRFSPRLVGGATSGVPGSSLGSKAVAQISPNSPYFSKFTCALAVDKTAHCWGSNASGQLGINADPIATPRKLVPTSIYTGGVLSGKTITYIATEGQNASSSDVGALSDGSNRRVYPIPPNSADGTNYMGQASGCVLAYTTSPFDTKPYCWGSNLLGQLGVGGSTPWIKTSPPVNYPAWVVQQPVAVNTSGVLNNMIITELTTADRGACVIAYPQASPPQPPTTWINKSRVYCWGDRRLLGNGATSNAHSNVPVAVIDNPTSPKIIFGPTAIHDDDTRIHSIQGGAHRACAIADGVNYCWGANGEGQIGDGTKVNPRRYPTEAIFLRPHANKFIY